MEEKKNASKKNTEWLIYVICAVLGLIAGILLGQNKELSRIEYHKAATTNTYSTPVLEEGQSAVQEFVAQLENLRYLVLLLNTNSDAQGEVLVSIYDEEGMALSKVMVPVSKIKSGAWQKVRVDAKVSIGKTYYIGVETKGANGVTVSYRELYLDRIEENQRFYYTGTEIPGACMAIQYGYAMPIGKLQRIVYVFFAVFLAELVGSIICTVRRKWL